MLSVHVREKIFLKIYSLKTSKDNAYVLPKSAVAKLNGSALSCQRGVQRAKVCDCFGKHNVLD